MYYDTYRKKKPDKKRKRKKSSCLGWLIGLLFKLILFMLIIVLLAGGLLYIMPVSMMNIQPAGVDLALTDGLPGNRVNILLLGLDYLDEDHPRSDTMIVASIGNDGVKLISVMRDVMVDLPGHSSSKINSAYALGGAELSMRAVNEAFGLNITNYAAVNLGCLVDLVDAVGGVVVDISERELEYINSHAWDTYKIITAREPEKYAHYAASQPITQTGPHKLDGLFAAAYARIRHADSDYMRTARQREVLTGILKQVRENFYNPELWLNLYDVLQNSVQTNLTLPEIISLAEKILISGEIEATRTPFDAYMADNGSSIRITDTTGNMQALHEFIYS